MENDVGNAYPHDTTIARRMGHKHEKPGYNMQIVCHMEKEEDADRHDLIDMRVFKPTSANATKRLRV